MKRRGADSVDADARRYYAMQRTKLLSAYAADAFARY